MTVSGAGKFLLILYMGGFLTSWKIFAQSHSGNIICTEVQQYATNMLPLKLLKNTNFFGKFFVIELYFQVCNFSRFGNI